VAANITFLGYIKYVDFFIENINLAFAASGTPACAVYLSIRQGDEAVCIVREEGSYPIKTLTLRPGDRRPLGVGAGSLALLAYLPNEEIDQLLAANADRIEAYKLDANKIRELVADARQRGFAYNPGLLIPGMSAIGVPVLKVGSTVFAALSVAAISERMSHRRLTEIAGLLLNEARSLQDQLAPVSDAINGLAADK
jgi:DNA-binding IclR family transcriptional regulator